MAPAGGSGHTVGEGRASRIPAGSTAAGLELCWIGVEIPVVVAVIVGFFVLLQ